MDATALLALAAKVNKVFHEEESFLSVPLGLPSYSPEQFAAIPRAPESASQLLQLSEFSRLVNLKPDGAIWRRRPSALLWTIVSDIFKNAIVANKQDAVEDESQYHQALSVLRRKNDKGDYVDSEKVRSYRQYEDAWRQLIQRHRAAEANERDQHHLLGIRSELESLNVDWLDKGFKEEVEDALRSLHNSSPQRIRHIWDDWSLRLMDSVDKLTDIHGNRFMPTVYSPSNVIESPAWVTIEIDADELQSLVADAEPELATVLDIGDSSKGPIVGIKFQATSVSIVRSWLSHDLFSSRFWRFQDPNRMLDWEGYVTGLVLIRNLQIFTEPTIETPDPIVDPDKFVGEEQSAKVPLDREAASRKVRDRWIGIGVGVLVFSFWYMGRMFAWWGQSRYPGDPLLSMLDFAMIAGLIFLLYWFTTYFLRKWRATRNLTERPTETPDSIVDPEVLVDEGQSVEFLLDPDTVLRKVRDRRVAIGIWVSVLIWGAITVGAFIGVEGWPTFGAIIGIIYFFVVVFLASGYHERFEKSKPGKIVRLTVFVFLVALVWISLVFLNSKTLVAIFPVPVGVMLFWYWLTTRFRPIQRVAMYFKDKLTNNNYARLTPEDSRGGASLGQLDEPPMSSVVDDYPDRIFIAAFVSRRLGRVPDPDESLQW